MATPSGKLAESLEVLRQLQTSGMVAIKSNAISRTHRERLNVIKLSVTSTAGRGLINFLMLEFYEMSSRKNGTSCSPT